MLTASDERTDGQFLSYLDRSEKWRGFDPDLFDHLFRCVRMKGERDVRLVEGGSVLPRTSFFARLLSDDVTERRRYFVEMLEDFRGLDLIFLDPDNGFEVLSKPRGRKDSSKYLYWDEASSVYSAGYSVLVYQHFVRESRDDFIARIADEMGAQTGADELYSFRTPHVVFFLALQPEHADHFRSQVERVSAIWQEQIRVKRH